MPHFKLIAFILITLTMAGCASVVGKTTNQSISTSPGLRSAGAVIEDEIIENKILVNLTQGTFEVRNAHVSVVSFNGNVLLAGQVPTEAAKQEAERIASTTRRVKRVHNELQIAGPTSLLIRSNDTYLTSRAKVSLLASQNANGIRIKLLTENGTVYLMGLLTRAEAQAAVDEIVTIAGVRKIVKVFEYID